MSDEHARTLARWLITAPFGNSFSSPLCKGFDPIPEELLDATVLYLESGRCRHSLPEDVCCRCCENCDSFGMRVLEILDREIPRRGPCLIYGRRLDARHRIVDAIRGMGHVGMSAPMIFEEYDGSFSLAAIRAALRAPPWHSLLRKADIHEEDAPWLEEIEIAKAAAASPVDRRAPPTKSTSRGVDRLREPRRRSKKRSKRR